MMGCYACDRCGGTFDAREIVCHEPPFGDVMLVCSVCKEILEDEEERDAERLESTEGRW